MVMRFNIILIDDPKPSWEPDVKAVDILKINMDLLCKIHGCWFYMLYLTCCFCLKFCQLSGMLACYFLYINRSIELKILVLNL